MVAQAEQQYVPSQKQTWLFEAPFVQNSNSQESYIHPESEIAWELWEEEFRRHNQKFRKEMAAKIGSTTNHPLQFLVKKGKGGKTVWRTAKDLRVDAGHIVPVVTLKKRGWKTERLAVQDRRLNQSDGGKMGATGTGRKIQVIDIRGVPVDLQTAKKYVEMGLLSQSVVNQAKTHKGWTPDGEFFFALSESQNSIPQFNQPEVRHTSHTAQQYLFEAPLNL